MGFEVETDKDKVYKMHKALYGLKQAPRAWYSKIDSYLQNQRSHKSLNEATLYVMEIGIANSLIVSLYVDDLLITCANTNGIAKLMATMEKEFNILDLGLMTYFLGLKVSQTGSNIHLTQQDFIAKVWK